MDLQHRFTVPAGVEETWATFTDIEGVAGCFPGAVVTEADAESFAGTVKVKLGPIALVYNGTGTFVEMHPATHRLVIDARGKDKRGNGTAGAVVTATLSEGADGATTVEVSTDLSITGKAAQFGRGGVIQDVSDKLLGQFVACLEQRLTAAPESPPEEGSDAAPQPEDPIATAVPSPVPSPVATPVPRSAAAQPPQSDEALDLGAAVLPVLARAYWKPAVGVLAVVAFVWWLIARK